VTEPKEATPRRIARTVHPNAVQTREALRIASVWAKLTSSSPVHPIDRGVEQSLTITMQLANFCGVCSRLSVLLPANHGPAGYFRTVLLPPKELTFYYANERTSTMTQHSIGLSEAS